MGTLRLIVAMSALSAAPARAQSSGSIENAGFPANAAHATMHRLFTNPPLPLIQQGRDVYKVALMPSYVTGELDRKDPIGGSGARQTGDFDGAALAASWTWGLRERHAFYFLVTGATVSGDFLHRNETNASPKVVSVTDARATYLMAGPAYAYRWGKGKVRWCFFTGPTLTHARYDATVRETQGTAPGGALIADYDLALDEFYPGGFTGLQAAFDVGGGRLAVNPFIVSQGSFGQATPKATVRSDPGGSGVLSDIRRGGTMAFSTGGPNFGVNLVYKPWGLAVSLTAPLLARNLFEFEKSAKGVEVTQFSLSKSFGNFSRQSL